MFRRADLVVVLAVSVVALTFLTSTATAEEPYELAWVRQLGTPKSDISSLLAITSAPLPLTLQALEAPLDPLNQHKRPIVA